ncbi:MAG TPA: hypothetical protein VF701_21115 [Thermoanaerobaculia bacterium]
MFASPIVIGRPGGEGARSLRVTCLVLLLCLPSFAFAAGALFPEPLHLTREISDPISGTTTVVDEYCHGNRIVSISGSRTAIVEHEKGTVTIIDFAAGTWSSATFEELARVRSSGNRVKRAPTARNEWRTEPRNQRTVASRSADTFEARRTDEGSTQIIHIAADRQIVLSRTAIEALLGVGHPNPSDPLSEAVIGALRETERRAVSNAASNTTDRLYRLPLEHVVRFETGGEVVETRNVVTRVGDELPPPDRLAIPQGAMRIEMPAIAAHRLLEELDRPAAPNLP